MKRLLVRQAAQGRVEIEGPSRHHLVDVLRVKPGDLLEVFDGKGQLFSATVSAVGERVSLELGAPREQPKARAIAVLQAMPRGEKLELVLQKGTELGAAGFALCFSERSVVKKSGREDGKLERWERIVEEAARQCGRAEVPFVRAPQPLREAAAALAKDFRLLVLDEEERSVPVSQAVENGQQPLAVVIGPEGGWTREEISALRDAGAKSVTLGRLVLRTETAALAALAVLRHLDGELG